MNKMNKEAEVGFDFDSGYGLIQADEAIAALLAAACENSAGDIDGDCSVDLRDAIISLQVVTGKGPAAVRSSYPSSGADVNGDNQVGTEEAINALREVVGF